METRRPRLRRAVFVDTSAWFALTDAGDTDHAAAQRAFRRLAAEGRRLCTTNHVVGETYTLLRMRLGDGPAHGFLAGARDTRRIERVFVEAEWETAAEELLAQYADQDFSYVDATSFIAMRRLALHEAFAFDHHFVVAGFRLLDA